MESISLMRMVEEGFGMKPGYALYENHCCVIESVTKHALGRYAPAFRLSARTDTIVLSFVRKGSMTVNCDTQTLKVEKNSLFSSHLGNVIRIEEVSEDFDCVVVLLEQSILDEMNVSIQKIIPHIGKFQKLHAIPLSPSKMDYGMKLLDLLFRCIYEEPYEPYYHEAVRGLISGLLYFILNVAISEIVDTPNKKKVLKSHEEVIFQKFIKSLRVNFNKERKITFYANELNLSPKYFSSVIRHFSGRGPSEWIDECVISEAKNLLRFSNKNIQEIAFELNFNTQSFFGRYFKHHTGYSPRAFKMM